MIDPGFYDDTLSAYLDSVGGVDAVLLTHGHWGHIAGADTLKADYPEAKIYMPMLDGELATGPNHNQSSANGFETILSSEINLLE